MQMKEYQAGVQRVALRQARAHTVGPWHINGVDTILSVSGNRSIAKVYHPEDDAHLIAEAPTLLGWAKRFQAVAEGIANGSYPASVYDWAAVAAECGKSIARADA